MLFFIVCWVLVLGFVIWFVCVLVSVVELGLVELGVGVLVGVLFVVVGFCCVVLGICCLVLFLVLFLLFLEFLDFWFVLVMVCLIVFKLFIVVGWDIVVFVVFVVLLFFRFVVFYWDVVCFKFCCRFVVLGSWGLVFCMYGGEGVGVGWIWRFSGIVDLGVVVLGVKVLEFLGLYLSIVIWLKFWYCKYWFLLINDFFNY